MTENGSNVAVVIPVFEADGRLANTIREIPDWVRWRIVVDDGSEPPVQLEESDRMIVVRHPRNLGVGAAILTGYRTARPLGCDVIAVMGADGQMDPSDLERVVAPVLRGEADYVVGDRLSHPDCPRTMPAIRRLGNYGLTFWTRWTSGYRDLMDSQCGFTAIRAEALERLPLDWLYPRYGFPNDLLAALGGAGARVCQVVVRPIYRGERSGIRPAVALVVYPFVLLRSRVVRAVAASRARSHGA